MSVKTMTLQNYESKI